MSKKDENVLQHKRWVHSSGKNKDSLIVFGAKSTLVLCFFTWKSV